MDSHLQEIVVYIQKYRQEGFTDEEIRAALVKSGVTSSLIEQAFTSGKKNTVSLRWAFLFMGLGLVLLILFLLFFFSQGSFGCNEEQDCPQGSFCSQGTCIEQIGMFNCQIEENCDRGYSCYKCVEEISSD